MEQETDARHQEIDARHEEIGSRVLEGLRGIPGTENLELPPPVFVEMGGRFTAYRPGELLAVRWPIRDWYRGPEGRMQGGLLVAMFDNAFGPLAYLLVESFVVTLGMDVTYVRPVTGSDDWVTTRVVPVETTRRFVFLRGEARSEGGKLLATCQTEMVIVGAGERATRASGG